ncbi:Arylsulfatase [Rubripirellula obstinata]|uniref:Arylsulfatase n=1 Tax=Rubripirellula obstinata TaxID=406547 RepID=A0A5B1CG09_9BACT|nr:sulfatase-like hydrolase/transferase [Rubripirellula obstinata]KAA1259122.1 Arylsulfatase [Rubripirellula obstinata]
MTIRLIRPSIVLAAFIFASSFVSAAKPSVARPNVIVLMADDLGYSDLGCYGGEIETPSIDALAEQGVRFSHFRATPMCVTSRIALLSGMPFHRAGGNAYSHSVPLPALLQDAGYRTLMTGKWHAGTPDPRSPELFHRSFGFLSGMSDCFIGADDWFEGDKPFNDFDPGFYSTDAFADKSIEFMKESAEMDQPFFMYVAFNAPHHPCQAPKPLVEQYQARYEQGYSKIRQARYQRQIEMGLIEPTCELAEVKQDARHWNELTLHRQKVEASRMAAYAAAVDGVDQAVGRIMDFTKQSGLDDNTLVVFLSDNGGDYNNGGINQDEKQIAWAPHGNPSSSNGWASVKATPFKYYKHSCHEGGIAAPMIVRWPAEVQRESGTIVRSPASITDFYPTIMELSGAEYPESFNDHQVRSLTGTSLIPLLKNDGSRKAKPDFQNYDFSRAWVEDEWKVVSLYDGPWELFNLKDDRSERHNLASEEPQRLKELSDRWIKEAVYAGVPNASAARLSHQHGWGWHRLKMVCPHLVSLTPENSSELGSTKTFIKLTFNKPIDFTATEGKSLRLYSVSDEKNPIWQASPDTNHSSQGTMELSFDDVPELDPDQAYYFLWDAGWIKVGNRPVGRLNDGAFWWRFRTPVQ